MRRHASWSTPELQPFVAPQTLNPTPPDADDPAAFVGGDEIMRIGTAIAMYRRHMGNILRPRTLIEHRYILERFQRHTNNMAIRAVKAKHVQDWLAEMDVQASTLRHRISVLRAFFRWAQRQELVKRDPMVFVDVPKQPRAAPRALDLDSLRALRTTLPDNRARLICTLMRHMGLRAGEVAGLEMADVNLFDNTMRITGKGGHTRILPIPPVVREHLDPYLGERGRGGGRLIRSHRNPKEGISAHAVSTLVAGWMRDAGIKAAAHDGVSAHALRHTCAEALYQHQVDVRLISKVMGHVEPTTTWEYLRFSANVEEMRPVLGQPIIE